MTTALKLWILGMLAVLSMLAAGIHISARNARAHAQAFLANIKALEIGSARLQDVVLIVRSAGGRVEGFESCELEYCSGRVYFENVWLHRFFLAPPTYFSCRLGIKSQILNDRWCGIVSFRRGRHTAVDWGAFVDEKPTVSMFNTETHAHKNEASYGLARVPSTEMLGIVLTPRAPVTMRELAYAFKLDCLSKIGGCKTREEMLPILGRLDLIDNNK